MKYKIQRQKKVRALNDSRCYNGCYYDASEKWGKAHDVDFDIPEEKLPERLAFWESLNAISVKYGGTPSRFQAVPVAQ